MEVWPCLNVTMVLFGEEETSHQFVELTDCGQGRPWCVKVTTAPCGFALAVYCS